MLAYKDIFTDKNKVLFVTAHPDDIDVFFAGTISLLRKDKITCFFLILTSGDMGSQGVSNRGLAKERESEQNNSLKIIDSSGKNVEFAHLKDGFLENDHQTISRVVKAIRFWQPEIVCTFDPRSLLFDAGNYDKYISHRDHRNCGQATIDAVYPYARINSYFSKYGSGFKVNEMLLADPHEHNTSIDVSEMIITKKKMLSAHKSQWTNTDIEEILDGNKEGASYIEKFGYFKLAW